MDNFKVLAKYQEDEQELSKVNKGLDEKIEESIHWFFGHVKRMKSDQITKRVHIGECIGSHSVGRPWKRQVDNVKKYLKKRGLDVRQARRMVQDKSEWQRVCDGECMGHSLGMNS